MFNEDIMVDNHIASTSRAATRLLDKLDEIGFISIDDNDMSEIIISKEDYSTRSKELESLDIKGCDNSKLKEYFDSFFKTTNRIKAKDRSDKKEKEK